MDRKEEQKKRKTKGFLPRRKTSKVERTFQKYTWNPSEITVEPIQKIINSHLNIKLGQFTEEELDAVLKKNTRKTADLDEIPHEIPQENLTTFFSDYTT